MNKMNTTIDDSSKKIQLFKMKIMDFFPELLHLQPSYFMDCRKRSTNQKNKTNDIVQSNPLPDGKFIHLYNMLSNTWMGGLNTRKNFDSNSPNFMKKLDRIFLKNMRLLKHTFHMNKIMDIYMISKSITDKDSIEVSFSPKMNAKKKYITMSEKDTSDELLDAHKKTESTHCNDMSTDNMKSMNNENNTSSSKNTSESRFFSKIWKKSRVNKQKKSKISSSESAKIASEKVSDACTPDEPIIMKEEFEDDTETSTDDDSETSTDDDSETSTDDDSETSTDDDSETNNDNDSKTSSEEDSEMSTDEESEASTCSNIENSLDVCDSRNYDTTDDVLTPNHLWSDQIIFKKKLERRHSDSSIEIPKDCELIMELPRSRKISESSTASEDGSFIVFDDNAELQPSESDEEPSDNEESYDKFNPKVRFTLKPRIHRMIKWDYAYRTARKGRWEEHARDRERFKCRIGNLSLILNSVLTLEHREKIFQDRFFMT